MSLAIEIIAVLFSLLSVFFSIKQNVLTWPFGLIGVVAYFIIFYETKLYAETTLQVFFVIQMAYGWFLWNKPKEEIKVRTIMPNFEFLNQIVSISVITFIVYLLLGEVGGSRHVVLDATSSVLSLFANFFLAKKIIETWFLWMLVNIILTYVFLIEALYLSAGLYFVFLILSFLGYISWKKDLKTV